MVLCERCGKHNEDYCNYCSDEGNEMSTFERKLILNENENKYCDGCGHETKSNQIYCSECGKLLSQVGKRRKTKRKITQNTGNINNPSLGSINEATGAMAKEAKKIFEGISKHSDLAFNQAKMAVDKISVFDQHQILDGLYQDVISDDSYEKEKVRFFLLWGALNEQLQENTIKYCTDLSAQKIFVSQIPYFEGFYAQCENKGAMKTILERWKSENTTLKTAIEDFL